jgi:hypothetical protein
MRQHDGKERLTSDKMWNSPLPLMIPSKEKYRAVYRVSECTCEGKVSAPVRLSCKFQVCFPELGSSFHVIVCKRTLLFSQRFKNAANKNPHSSVWG